MLTQEEIIEKLYRQVEIFRRQYYTKKYSAASMTEFIAHVVATFVELDEDKMIELFGICQGETREEIIGLFPEEQVIDANWQVVLHHRSLQEITRQEKREREEAWEKSQNEARRKNIYSK